MRGQFVAVLVAWGLAADLSAAGNGLQSNLSTVLSAAFTSFA